MGSDGPSGNYKCSRPSINGVSVQTLLRRIRMNQKFSGFASILFLAQMRSFKRRVIGEP
jgi:hypothetical protein